MGLLAGRADAAWRALVRAEVAGLVALDGLEAMHIACVLAWIDSGAPLCRTAKPATPPVHLVSYFLCIDGDAVLLVDHRLAQMWLPTGGHVEPGEHPRETVARELREELGREARIAAERPLFLTVTETVGLTAGHTDVSLWYVVELSRDQPVTGRCDEFREARWFSIEKAAVLPSDPHLPRFLKKLASTGSSRQADERARVIGRDTV
jgi:8-oxo-dGTP pyrophosphatase MutT (NUDIX family)